MNFVSSSEVKPKANLSMLLYGATGIGKTTLALSAPNPAIVDFDGGITRVDSRFWTDKTAQVDKWEGWTAMVNGLATIDADSIIIDTIGKMLDMITAYVLASPKYASKNLTKPSLQAFGDIKVEFTKFLHGIKVIGKNLVFVAQEVETTISTPKGDVRYRIPACGSDKNRTELLQDLDLVGYMYKDGDATCITFDQTDAYYGKNTCALGHIISVPVCATTDDNVIISDIVEEFNNYQKANIERKSAAGMLYNKLKVQIDAMNSAADVNAFCASMRGVEWVQDAKARTLAALNERVQALQLTYNSKTKLYA